MKKSLLALLLAMLPMFSATLVYADDEMATSDDASATMEEPLPPLMDDSGS